MRSSGRWCPKCAHERSGATQRLTIEQMHELAESRGGKCLSSGYLNAHSKLRWRCGNGHEWSAVPGSVRAGRWCQICSKKSAALKRRVGITFFHELAESRGGTCLSSEYISASSHLKWMCSNGHKWEAIPDSVKRGSWCSKCSSKIRGKNQRATVQSMVALADRRGGKFISLEYFGNQIKHTWECKQGHRWDAMPGSILAGTWCPDCAGRRRLTIEDAHKLALEKKGACLSTTLDRKNPRLEWQCQFGHVWSATIHSLRSGSWCPDCAGVRKHTILTAQKVAEKFEGQCLSKRYKNISEKIRWQCARGHQWQASLYAVMQGQWCSVCTGRSKPTLAKMQNMARERGGTCTSKRYVSAKSPLGWACKFGHKWSANYGTIRRGAWCPECQLGVGERICRQYFEQIFRTPFPSTRPKWLVNPKTSLPLELDGFSESLKLAFEHQGAQHYHLRTPFIKSETHLAERKALDQIKRETCLKYGIRLIEVPSVPDLLSLSELPSYLKSAFEKNKIPLPRAANWNDVDLRKAYAPDTKVMLDGLRELARSRQGKCLSKIFLGSTRKHDWECIERHRWSATPVKIRSGRWCRRCAGTEPRTIEEMREYAKFYGGKCLSEVYRGGKTKLKWECRRSHTWWALPTNINKGGWCAKCYHLEQRLREPIRNIDEVKSFARAKGGECLSQRYWRSSDRLNWKCRAGHTWSAVVSSVLRGSWCAKCGRESANKVLRTDISRLMDAATKRGGRLVSTEYQNFQTKMTWECADEHQWQASAGSVLSGTWCPKCAGKQRGDRRRTGIETLRSFAVARGGSCLSRDYEQSNQKLRWRCAEGHEWTAIWSAVKTGGWCPECANKTKGAYRKLSLNDLNEAATERGGTCLSKIYLGSQKRHEWRCAKGHQWWAVATSIITRRSWCPECAPNKKRTLQDMQARAEALGGRCLSRSYVNAHTHLEWICANGHRWKATPDNVQQGYWCRKCERRKYGH